jgi:hypothetical protein
MNEEKKYTQQDMINFGTTCSNEPQLQPRYLFEREYILPKNDDDNYYPVICANCKGVFKINKIWKTMNLTDYICITCSNLPEFKKDF